MLDSAVAWPTMTPMKEVETVTAQQMQKASNRAPSPPPIVLENASTETRVPDNAGVFDGIQTNTVAVAVAVKLVVASIRLMNHFFLPRSRLLT